MASEPKKRPDTRPGQVDQGGKTSGKSPGRCAQNRRSRVAATAPQDGCPERPPCCTAQSTAGQSVWPAAFFSVTVSHPATLSRKGARIPFAAHVALLEHAAAAARDPCFGLHLGAALHPRDLGLVGYLGANAATLGDVLRYCGQVSAPAHRRDQGRGRGEGRAGAGRAAPSGPCRGRQPAGRRPGREQPGTGRPAPHRYDARASVDRAAVRQS